MSSNQSSDMNKFFEQFKLFDGLLGKGAFGRVFKGQHIKTGKEVAIKFENENKYLKEEYKVRWQKLFFLSFLDAPIISSTQVYDQLADLVSETKPIPLIYGYGTVGEMGWLAMDLLGPSIGDIFKERKNFSKCTIKLLGRQMVECLEYLHVRDIVHCDVKSDNFAISATNPNKIVIFDFGLACAKDTNNQVFRGSLLYASIAAHRFEAVTPRHDLGSLGYLLCDFYSPLPWKSSQKSFPGTDMPFEVYS